MQVESVPFANPVPGQAANHRSDRQEPSNAELAALLRQAADQGRLIPLEIRHLVARRIEEAELASLLTQRA